MRFESLSVLATVAASGLQLAAAESNSGWDLFQQIDSVFNPGSSTDSTSSSSQSLNGKEVIVVVSQDVQSYLHTLTTSTRLGVQPTDTAVTSTKFHNQTSSSSFSRPASPSASPTSTKSGDLFGGGIGGAVNNVASGVNGAVSGVASGLNGAVSGVASGVDNVASGVASGVSGAASDVGSGIQQIVSPNVTSATSTPLSTAYATGSSSSSTTSQDWLNWFDNSDSSTTSSTASSTSSTTPKDLLDLLGLKDSSTTTSTPLSSMSISSGASGTYTIPVSVPLNASASATATPSTTSAPNPLGDLAKGIGSGIADLFNGTSANASSTGLPPLFPSGALPSIPLSIPKPSKPAFLNGTNGTSTPLFSGSLTNPIGSIPTPHVPSTRPSGKPFGTGLNSTTGSNSTAWGSTGSPSGPASGSGSQSSVTFRPTSTPVSTSTPKTTATPSSTYVAPTTSSSEPSTSSSTDDDWMPSTILVLPTETSSDTATATASNTQAPALPGSITPNNITEPPPNSMLLQIGFDGSLPWSWVATVPVSSSQILRYIPRALAYASPKYGSQAAMWALKPYDNWQQTGYNATVAIFYFPRDGFDEIKQLHSNVNSALYQVKDSESVTTLMGMVDPTIPLVYSENGSTDSGSGGGGSGGNGGNGGGSGGADGGSGSSSTGKASAAGIATGAVAGAAAYGAAMFWVARRYRKRRQLHQRASSTGDAMSQGSAPASAAGAGSQRTGRSQMISAPVMAENSLGWN